MSTVNTTLTPTLVEVYAEMTHDFRPQLCIVFDPFVTSLVTSELMVYVFSEGKRFHSLCYSIPQPRQRSLSSFLNIYDAKGLSQRAVRTPDLTHVLEAAHDIAIVFRMHGKTRHSVPERIGFASTESEQIGRSWGLLHHAISEEQHHIKHHLGLVFGADVASIIISFNPNLVGVGARSLLPLLMKPISFATSYHEAFIMCPSSASEAATLICSDLYRI